MSHGAFIWNELLTHDVEGAKAFYAALVGWTYQATPMQDGTYWLAHADGKPVAGIMAMPKNLPPTTPPHWFEYLEVDDVDARLAVAAQHGGKVLHAPFDIPNVGRIAIVSDAGGAPLGLMTPAPRA